MARILITGAHGFIGRHLAQHLSRLGHKVGGVGHGTWPASEAAVWGISAWVNGDVVTANLNVLQHDFGNPDLVYHLAGGSSVGAAILNPREDFFRSVVSTAELLEWLRQQSPQTPLVAISSAAVYGAGHRGPIARTASLNPYSPYGHHKHMMEELCRSYTARYGLQIAVARLFSVYGPGLKKQLLWDICTQLAGNPDRVRLGGTGLELRDWTHIADVTQALAGIGELPAADMPIVNLGTGLGTPVEAIARRLVAYWHGTSEGAPPVHFSGQSRPGDPFSLIAGESMPNLLRTSWQDRLDDGLAEYVRWYRARDGAGA